MVRFLRYTIIAISAVFLLATYVSSAMPYDGPDQPPFIIQLKAPMNQNSNAKPQPVVDDIPEREPLNPPIVSEPVVPMLSAPLSTLPTAVAPDPNRPPQEINPRQNPTEKN